MNVILLTAEEAQTQPVVLTDERATHIREVLRSKFGHTVRVGILEGPLGTATIENVDPHFVTLACEFESRTPPRGADSLLLAVPRPIVLRRCLAAAASLGFARIVLFRSWRVEKSHLDSKIFDPAVVRTHLVAGLSQARRTRLPEVLVYPLFKPFIEDQLDHLVPRPNRYVAHPDADTDIADTTANGSIPFTVAFGPEGGFIDYEVQAFAMLGFTPVSAGRHPLRVETALAYVTGQLDLARKRAR